MAAPASAVRAARAWLLDVGDGFHVAAGAHHVIEYLLSPETVTIPCTPVCAPGVLLWREWMIPWVDFTPLLSAGTGQSDGKRRAVVLAWQDAPEQPLRYGALMLSAAPVETFVTDDMACATPSDPPAIQRLSLSSFMFNDKPVPVLDVARLFSQSLADTHKRLDESDSPAPKPVSVAPAEPQPAAPSVRDMYSDSVIALPLVARSLPVLAAPVRAEMTHAASKSQTPVAIVVSLVPSHTIQSTEMLRLAPSSADRLPDAAPPDVMENTQLGAPEIPHQAAQAPPPPLHRYGGTQTLESVKRRRAMERAYLDRQHPRSQFLKAGLVAAIVALLALSALWLLNIVPRSTVVPAASRVMPATRDVGPGKVEEISAPSAPVRPPS